MLEALFALCRKTVENEPLKIFMAISDIDRNRSTPLDAATVDRLAREYHTYGSQYPLFSESRALSEKSIAQYLDTVAAISKVKEPSLHSDLFFPVPEPSIRAGVLTMSLAVLNLVGKQEK